MKRGKSPGPDGFTIQYYKTFLPILWSPFKAAFNALLDVHDPPTSLLEVHITVIPKGNKDPMQADNYRPIFFLNVDLQLYAKILAIRITPLLPSWVSLDQVDLSLAGRPGTTPSKQLTSSTGSPPQRFRVSFCHSKRRRHLTE